MSVIQAALSLEVAYYRDRSSTLQFQLEDVTAALDVAKSDYINLEFHMEEDVGRLEAENRDKERELSHDIVCITARMTEACWSGY